MSYNKRLQLAMKHANLNQTELANKTNIAQSSINYLLSENAQGSKHTNKIANTCGVNSSWLANGEGEMLAVTSLNDEPGEYTSSDNQIKIPIVELKNIDNSDINGFFTVDYDWFYKTTGIKPSKHIRMTVAEGDAMKKKFDHGDLLLIDASQTEKINGLFVLKDENNQNTIKRIDFKGDEVTLISDSEFYSDRTIPFKNINLISRIIFIWNGVRV